MTFDSRQNATPFADKRLLERLNRIAWPIKRHWAKHYPIRLTSEHEISHAATDYQQVLVNRSMARFDDASLFVLLAHEWMHRMGSPKSLEIRRRIFDLVEQSVNLPAPFLVQGVNLAIELIVDQTNCDVAEWGYQYTQAHSLLLEDILQTVGKTLASANSESKHTHWTACVGLATRRLMVNRDPLPEAFEKYRLPAMALVNSLRENWPGTGAPDDPDDPDHIGKITRFVRKFSELIPRPLPSTASPLDDLIQLLGQIERDLRRLPGNSLHPPRIAQSGQQSSTSRSRSNGNYDRDFDTRIVRTVSARLFQAARKARPLTGLWQPGQPVSRLDLKRSQRVWPGLIPGLTTHRYVSSGRLSRHRGVLRHRLCLVVDDSGSMGGNEARFARSLAQGVTQFAALRQIETGLITFGGDVDVREPPGTRYHTLTRHLQRLDGKLGGTCLGPALARVEELFRANETLTQLFLITDAEVADLEESEAALTRILRETHMIVLLINSEIPDAFHKRFGKLAAKVRFYKADPRRPPENSWLEELFK
jgi:Mg-chelatase subunit ChlD